MNRPGLQGVPWMLWTVYGWLAATLSVSAATIDTEFIQRPWPNQQMHELEVGRHEVRWRQWASRTDGIFAGVRFETPLARQTVWQLANDYQDVSHTVPGVTAVRFLEQSETHEVIEVDVKVLWKRLTLNFEVEKEPPRIMRFRLVNRALGEYRGVCVFEESTGTSVELATWLKPAHPVPMGLLLVVERIALLHGAREFLIQCDRNSAAVASQAR